MTTPTRKEFESVLREAGFSHRKARRIVGMTWQTIVGEEQAAEDEVLERLESIRHKFAGDKQTEG